MKLIIPLVAATFHGASAFAPVSRPVFANKVGRSGADPAEVVPSFGYPVGQRRPSSSLWVSTQDGSQVTMKSVPMDGPPTVSVTGTVRAPVADVWKVFREFGEPTTEWWHIYKYLVLEPPGKDVVGAERTFQATTGGRTTTEKLVERDDKKHRMVYSLTAGEGYPEGYEGTTTLVEMKEEGSETTVTWSSWSEVDPKIKMVVMQGQSKAYKSGIEALDDYLNPNNPAENIGNAALLVLGDIKERVLEIVVNMVKTEPHEPWEYANYDKSLGPLPKYCKILPADAAIVPFRTGQIFQRNSEYIYSQTPLLGFGSVMKKLHENPTKAALSMAFTPEGKKLLAKLEHLKNDPFLAPFTGLWFPEPETVIKNLNNDATSDMELAAQLIRGVNPMKITVANKVKDLPAELRVLKDKHGRSVKELIEAKSLFYCDYWEVATGDYDEEMGYYYNQALGIGGEGTIGPLKYWYAPKLAVYKNKDGKLDILGFTLTRFEDKPNEVYTKDATPSNLYKLAKYHLSCADNQQHQFVSHLGMAHLNMEPFAVANNNAFPPGESRHPIGKLLHPHFQDTIGINFLARQTLVSEVAPFTDATFSPGTFNAMRIFSRAFEKWDFFGDNFVNGLQARGFDEAKSDGVEGFYYRDDGFKVWNALKNHFTRCVDKIYANDKEVANDRSLEMWCKEVRDPERGAMPSFPETIETKEMLVETITSIVFYCSAQHSAVNFSQLRYVAYVPNRPDSMRLPMVEPEKGDKDIDKEKLNAALPSFVNSEFQSLFSYLLTTPPDNPFEVYKSTGEEFKEETDVFLAELQLIHEDIKLRNNKLVEAGDVPYEYLDPITMPQSINI